MRYKQTQMNEAFSYSQAFSRNVGRVTTEEPEVRRRKRVGIAEKGHAEAVHLLTLTRLLSGFLLGNPHEDTEASPPTSCESTKR